jgi:voltage-gated potassium channel
MRYNRAITRFQKAFGSIREELILFFSTAGLLLFFAAVVVYFCERDAQPEVFASVFHSLWWAVVTLTTVGYGDIYPVTVLGRVFTFIVLMVGLGIVAVPAGLMSSALSRAHGDHE